MSQLFVNNADTVVNGSLSEGATTLVLLATSGAVFPAPENGDYFLGTLYEKDLNGADARIEIVKVTARTADTLTIERDFEGMTGSSGGYSYPSEVGKSVYFSLRWTAHAAMNVLQKIENLGDLPDVATAKANLGLNLVDNTSDLNKPVSTATQTALDGKSATGHGHTIADVAALQTALDGKSATSHNHTGTYQPLAANLTSWAALAPAAKQDALVSGTSIKTVGGVSLLGSGDISLDPGVITAMAALDVNCSLGNYFTKTISANSTFTFSNIPSGKAYAFTIELTHTSGTVTWPTTVKWPGDTAPSLTTGKTHLFVFVTDDGGTRWRGVANTNYVN